MTPEEINSWKEQILDEVLQAISQHDRLREILVFKGARVLNELLNTRGRRSLDIDSNLLKSFVESTPDRAEQRKKLEEEISTAVSQHFERGSPVRYTLARVRIEPIPPIPKKHPRGWDAYRAVISVSDHTKTGVRGLPNVVLDIAAPEALREDSITVLNLGSGSVFAYTLERIAGEKLRAFLSSLPTYRAKVKKPGEAVRVKDIFDIARICRARDLEDHEFWQKVGEEFRLACESRVIDCVGLASFEENLATTQDTYHNDPTLPKEISFEKAWAVIQGIVSFLEDREIVPFEFPVE